MIVCMYVIVTVLAGYFCESAQLAKIKPRDLAWSGNDIYMSENETAHASTSRIRVMSRAHSAASFSCFHCVRRSLTGDYGPLSVFTAT